MRFLGFAGACTLGLSLSAFVACGARSGLGVPAPRDAGAGGEAEDAGFEAGHDAEAGVDAEVDAPIDAQVDAPEDAPADVVITTNCADASVLFIYLISQQNNLYSFYPPDGALTLIGPINCGKPPNVTPYSMGVNRPGFGFSVFTDGTLNQINMADAKCQPTAYIPDQQGWHDFGMGFSTNGMGPSETLYVAEISNAAASKGLASIDLATLTLNPIGAFSQNPGSAIELTGTGDGRLFGYFLDKPGPGGHVVEIDKTNANIISSTPVAAGSPVSALAFAFWGGDFYIFTTNANSGTDITRYQPATSSAALVGTIADIIVGAGVSTCAPQ